MRILGDVTTATTATGALCMGGAEGVWGATTVFAGDWFNGTRKQLPGEVLSRRGDSSRPCALVPCHSWTPVGGDN